MAPSANYGDQKSDIDKKLRALPSIDSLLNTERGGELIAIFGRRLTVKSLRSLLDRTRNSIRTGDDGLNDRDDLLEQARILLESYLKMSLRPVINATGVIIHTNLGRAPIGAGALDVVDLIGSGYSNLEYEISAGMRGSRSLHAEDLLTQITGSEAALVVNNNASSIILMLTALCHGKEVIISRGQLIEIGGGFRLTDVMAQSGAILVEVGTTNRTHLYDYERAISDNTAAILVAHHSNFRIVGFTSEPSLAELSNLAHQHGLSLLYDQGSGVLLDTSRFGLDTEKTVMESLESGADLVAFSGDKLVGGPQAGIICGRDEFIGVMKDHPLARVVRPDKLCLAALSAGLLPYLKGTATEEIPVWQMISLSLDEIKRMAEEWAATFHSRGISANVIDGDSTIGGGSLPGATLPTKLVALSHPNIADLADALRANDPPIVSRISSGLCLLDPRTILPGQGSALVDGVLSAWSRFNVKAGTIPK